MRPGLAATVLRPRPTSRVGPRRRGFHTVCRTVLALAGSALACLAAGPGIPALPPLKPGPGAQRSWVIAWPLDAPATVEFAAREVRRYVWLRTGELLPFAQGAPPPPEASPISLHLDPALAAQQYRLASDGASLTISGGSALAILYGAYGFAEKLGVRFYLHGDVVPDERIPFDVPPFDETHAPLFALRGVNPWGSHPFGFDAWSADDYKAVIAQLAKMRMNFIGMHCYPEGRPYAEPTVWHGLAGDFDAAGRVQASYVSRYFNTLLTPAWGDYLPKRTGDYSFGAAGLFESDDWAPPAFAGCSPLPQTPDACNDVFNRVAAQFNDAFTFARRLGVKTCLGTEAPLLLPQNVARRSTDARAVYEATFRRIMAAHPLDYYWIWTPESWTWEGNRPEQYSNTVADIRLALEAHRQANAPFRLATAGWVLGPQHDRAALDRDLPKHLPMSALSRNTGAAELDPAFGRIAGRETWAIPWLESDNREGLAALQLEVGRVRRDAADARGYGCTGLLGLHWRTDILAPNASALAQAGWEQPWRPPPAVSPWSVAGAIADYPDAAIAGTADAPLYRSCRYDLETIRLAAPDGTYQVTLKFCEPHFSAAGERIADVRLQGRTVLTNLDIFAQAGRFAALDYTFDDVPVRGGALVVEFVARKSLPCVSAIAVTGPGFTRKLNCGGPAYRDWQADAPAPRRMPCDDFYADWAQVNFGLREAGRVFAGIDGQVPQVTDGGCPSGRLTAIDSPWETLAPRFAFVDELERLRPRVRGAGNLDRFDGWLSTFQYVRSLAQLRCALARPDAHAIARLYADAYRHLLATVNTPGGLATVVNLENHPGWGPSVAQHAAQPSPREYPGKARLIVPTVRSVVARGETLTLRIIAIDRQPVQSVTVRLRPLGRGQWSEIPASPLARAVWLARLPAASEDFEYSLAAVAADGSRLVWPATAPMLNQTVVVTD